MSRHVVNWWLGRALMAFARIAGPALDLFADLLDHIPSRKWSE